ncbi:disease resistance protein RPV1 isoform X2 [Jatropha curcas]|nr:disease resistance protein RPV1 isoform X2 [Jatropha curcas]
MAYTRGYQYSYHVILSFKGDDTGKNFSDHLYAALEQAGIHTFRDEDGIERGDDVDVETEKAMQGSKMCLIVFSKDYASSIWCLNQLVKIMEQREISGFVVMPVFYDADPTQVWEQSGSYAEAFARHEQQFKDEIDKVEKWRAVLREITDLSGMDLQGRHEAEFIQDIVKKVGKRLNRSVLLHAPSYLVGIDSRVKDINIWLQDGSNGSCIAIIYGIGGIGKTTIAKTVYNLNLDRFEGSCFLANVRETSKDPDGLILLQKQLIEKFLNGKTYKIKSVDEGSVRIKDAISCKRVLIVLDDVDQLEQLNAIFGTWDWLYEGSKVIITTRHERLLGAYETYKKFRVKELDDNESLQLFSWHAFGQDYPIEGYKEHSEKVISHCFGIPLALQIFGSSLSVNIADEWESALEKLRAIPDSKLHKILRISYDSLQDDHDKNLFLHIACFFIGRNGDYVIKILDGCEFYTKVGLQNLIDRNLVTINEDNKLMMHPLLRDMGREIIRQEAPENPGKRSLLWYHEDAFTVLRENIGTEAIKGLTINLRAIMADQQHTISCINCAKRQYYEDLISKSRPKRLRLGFLSWQSAEIGTSTSFPVSNEVVFDTKPFAKMHKLKLLQLSYVKLIGGYEHFPKSLIWLCWHGFPLKSLPSNLYLGKLVVLDMRYSGIKHVWSGNRVLVQLKILNLSHSHDLVSTPDFSGLPNLEILKLKDCINLVEVHESIADLKRLVLLNLKDCKRLRKLSRKFVMLRTLDKLILSGCSKLDQLPSELWKLESLKVLHADGMVNSTTTSRQSTFWSWSSRRQGRESSLSLTFLPHSLECLSLGYCNLSDDAIDFTSLPSLKYLNLSGNSIYCLPETINSLTKLEILILDHCKNLQSLSKLPSSLKELSAENCEALERITNLPNLMRSLMLNLTDCKQLIEVQGLFKLEPISNLDREMANELGFCILKSAESIKVEMCSVMMMTSRIIPPQVLHECGISSIFLPGDEVPGWYNPQNEGSSISFSIAQSHGCNVLGLNICTVYTCNNIRNGPGDHLYTKVWNKTKDLRWTYSPTFHGIPETDEIMLWLSHWKLGDQLEVGDELNVSVVMSTGYQVKKFGIHVVYEQEKENTQLNSKETKENISSWYQTSDNLDMELYRVRRDAFYLSNHDYLIHQEISESGWDNSRWYSHLFEQ